MFKKILTLLLLVFVSNIKSQDFINPPMVNIPSGSFMMGSERGNQSSKPMHLVNINAFQMAKYPVTVAEYRKFIEETNYKTTSKKCPDLIDKHWYSDPGKKSNGTWEKHLQSYSDYQPVTCVSYQDIQAYIKWINTKSGAIYRLPTEEEWEYSAKANTTTKYFWGNDINKAYLYANFADLSSEYFASKDYGASYVGFIGSTKQFDGEPYGSIVGLYLPNPFGLYDIVGNVSQFLSSCYSDDYKSKMNMIDSNKDCNMVAVRGGNWHYKPRPLWVRGRMRKVSDFSSTRRGFRLALDGHTKYEDESTQSFENKLKKAQQKRLTTRIRIPETPEQLQLIKVKDSEYKISWNKLNDLQVTGYDIYQSNTEYSHLKGRFFKESYTKIQSLDSDKNSSIVKASENHNSFIVVARTVSSNSLPSKPVVAKTKPTILTIPGRIDLEKNTAFENMTLGHRMARPDRPESHFFRIIASAYEPMLSMAKFKVNVEESGWYQVNYSGGPLSQKAGTFFMLFQNDKMIGEITYDSKVDNKISTHQKVYLEEGIHDLKVSFLIDLDQMDMLYLWMLKLTKI